MPYGLLWRHNIPLHRLDNNHQPHNPSDCCSHSLRTNPYQYLNNNHLHWRGYHQNVHNHGPHYRYMNIYCYYLRANNLHHQQPYMRCQKNNNIRRHKNTSMNHRSSCRNFVIRYIVTKKTIRQDWCFCSKYVISYVYVFPNHKFLSLANHCL